MPNLTRRVTIATNDRVQAFGEGEGCDESNTVGEVGAKSGRVLPILVIRSYPPYSCSKVQRLVLIDDHSPCKKSFSLHPA